MVNAIVENKDSYPKAKSLQGSLVSKLGSFKVAVVGLPKQSSPRFVL